MSVMQVIAALGSAPTVGFPVYLSNTATDLGGADATSHLVQMPATVNSGDLLIALIGSDGSATITTPSGWTAMSTDTSSTVRASAFYKVAAGTEGGTTVDFVTSIAERMEAQVVRIQSGTYQSAPETTATNSNAGSTTPDPPNLTPSWGSANTLWIAMMVADNTRTISVYPLPNNQVRTANASTGTAFVTLGTCSNDVAASSLNPGTFTINTSSPWATITLAVRPA